MSTREITRETEPQRCAHCKTVQLKTILGHFLYSRICQSKTAFFDISPNRAFLHSRKRAFSNQLSTEISDWGIQSNNLTFSTGSSSRKTQWEKFYACFFNPSHRSSHHKTHTHTHTRYHKAVSYNSANAALAITAAASRRKSACRTPSSARQQRVSRDSSSARYRCNFANKGYACCSFGGSRLNATPGT